MKLLTNSHFYHNLQSINDANFFNNILEISYYNSNRKLIAEYLYYFLSPSQDWYFPLYIWKSDMV